MDDKEFREMREGMSPEDQQILDEFLQRVRQQENAPEVRVQQSIPWTALLGAGLASIPGIIVWALLGSIGYTWSLVGALIVAGVFFAYSKICDKTGADEENRCGIIGCLVICVLAVYLGVHFAWAAQLHNALQEYDYDISLGECALRLYDFLAILEIRGKFVFAVIKGLAFAAIGGFWAIAKASGAK